MKNKLTLLITTLILSSTAIAQLPAEIDTTSGNWYLNWQDEFDYPDEQLEDNWISANGVTDNDIVLCSRWRENAVVANGILELKAIKEQRGGQDWTCGSIWTKSNDFKYGYYEARYKYAAAIGTNNSFWLYPYSKSDPEYVNKVELDINEGQYPNILKTNIHNWTQGDNYVHPIQEKYYADVATDLGEEYHTYGLLWTPTEHVFYFDGEEIRREDNPAYVQKNKWNTDGAWVYVENHGKTQLLLSLAILGHSYGGTITDSSSIDGTSMKVDFVRYYKNDDLILNLVDEAKNNMQVYPNPTADQIFFTNAESYNSLKIFNSIGRVVLEITSNPAEGVNVSHLPEGLYFYVMEGEIGAESGMFVKE